MLHLPIADDHQLVRNRTSIGDFETTICTDGIYFLDGGAMFGVVPKPLWEKRAPADVQNRILLGTNVVVLRNGKQTIVIETGIGNKLFNKPQQQVYGNTPTLPKSLAAAGVRPEEVDIVINTHLHFDHCGWNTTRTPDGRIVPTFPNARYFAQRGEVEPSPPARARPHQLHLRQLRSAHRHRPNDSARRPRRNLPRNLDRTLPRTHRAAPSRAHRISRRARRLPRRSPAYLRAPRHHLGHGYDLFPLTCIEQRKRFYSCALPERWTVLFTHDHRNPIGRIVLNDKQNPVLE